MNRVESYVVLGLIALALLLGAVILAELESRLYHRRLARRARRRGGLLTDFSGRRR